MKHFDEHISLPSIEEIEQYHNGLLSNERAYEIELLAQENPMVADALEGFAVVPAFASLPDFSSAMPAANATQSGISALAKTTSPWWHLNGWIIGLTVGATGAMLLGTIYNIPASANSNSEVVKVQTGQTNMFTNATNVQPNNLVTPIIVKPTAAVAKSNFDSSEVVINISQTTTTKINPPVAETIIFQRENFVSLSGINPDPEVLATEPKLDAGIKPSRLAAVQIAHIYDYKVADYSELRAGGWKPIAQIQSGTLASQENRDSKTSDVTENSETKAIPYMDYLTQCMNEFDQSRYSSAATHFALVLKQYPTDVNAQFYGSMSLYRDGKYQEALDGFDSVLKNMISVFNEEARFYKAKSLKALGRQEEAKQIFEKIIRENGFYAEDARKEI